MTPTPQRFSVRTNAVAAADWTSRCGAIRLLQLVVFNNQAVVERCPLSLALSEDGGKSWPWVRDLEGCDGLEDDARGDRTNHEYSYPAVIQSRFHKIHVTYTYRRQTIKHVVVDEAWIRADGRSSSQGLFVPQVSGVRERMRVVGLHGEWPPRTCHGQR